MVHMCYLSIWVCQLGRSNIVYYYLVYILMGNYYRILMISSNKRDNYMLCIVCHQNMDIVMGIGMIE